MVTLIDLGFAAHDARSLVFPLPAGRRLGRVIEEQKGAYRVLAAAHPEAPTEAIWAVLAGRLAHAALDAGELPAVGDFVLVEGEAGDGGRVRLAELLPRRTKLVRKAVGSVEQQVIAANVDVVFIVTSLNRDLNERRLERYLMAAWDGGALPVVLLSKADLLTEPGAVEEVLARVRSVALGAPIHVTSAASGAGVETVRSYLKPGTTVTLVGSSGVGKSTLINALLGTAVQDVQTISGDDKGRHTTTFRSLLMVPGGGVIVDTPGMREFMPAMAAGAAEQGGGVDTVFEDLGDLAQRCRFSDCRHAEEPGCAVQAAIASGALDGARLASYRKLQKEQAWLLRRQDARAASAERKKWKQIHKDLRSHPKKHR